jgi:arylsulfatase A-like enzyme
MDGSVGEILATLDRLNIANNTVIFFTSDNGPFAEAVWSMLSFIYSSVFRISKI